MLVIKGSGRRCCLVYWQFASVEVRVREIVPGICLWLLEWRWCWINKIDERAASEDDEVRGDICALSYKL